MDENITQKEALRQKLIAIIDRQLDLEYVEALTRDAHHELERASKDFMRALADIPDGVDYITEKTLVVHDTGTWVITICFDDWKVCECKNLGNPL